MLVSPEAKASGQQNLESRVGWPSPVDDEESHTFLLAEILEHRWASGEDSARWDVFGWHGGDVERVWVKSEGGASTSSSSGEADLQLLYGRLISPYFDLQAGIRLEEVWSGGRDDRRASAAVGLQGLAPHFFDVEPTLFVSQEGDVSARFTGVYDLLMTQRLVLQPRVEGLAAIQDAEDFGVGSGVNDLEAGLRLRYEFTREFAPYVGIAATKLFGETADFARAGGEATKQWAVVAGVRAWF
ncbi:MAG: copper resistance protein B [Gemmataceae bacterium]